MAYLKIMLQVPAKERLEAREVERLRNSGNLGVSGDGIGTE